MQTKLSQKQKELALQEKNEVMDLLIHAWKYEKDYSKQDIKDEITKLDIEQLNYSVHTDPDIYGYNICFRGKEQNGTRIDVLLSQANSNIIGIRHYNFNKKSRFYKPAYFEYNPYSGEPTVIKYFLDGNEHTEKQFERKMNALDKLELNDNLTEKVRAQVVNEMSKITQGIEKEYIEIRTIS